MNVKREVVEQAAEGMEQRGGSAERRAEDSQEAQNANNFPLLVKQIKDAVWRTFTVLLQSRNRNLKRGGARGGNRGGE